MKIFAILFPVLLAGCISTPPSFHAGAIGVCPLLCEYGAYTQITADKAATAGHATFAVHWGAHPIGREDMAWFHHEGAAPVIRAPQLDEKVTCYGNSPVDAPVAENGWVLGTHAFIQRADHKDWGIVFAVSIFPGFSGGGCYGADHALLGIITDNFQITEGSAYDGPAAFGYAANDIAASLKNQNREESKQ